MSVHRFIVVKAQNKPFTQNISFIYVVTRQSWIEGQMDRQMVGQLTIKPDNLR